MYFLDFYDWAVFFYMLHPVLLVFFMLSEADSLRAASVCREAGQLACHSSVADADSTNEDDKRAILTDVGDSVDAVDKSISVLLAASMSTPRLRAAADCGVDMAGAAELRLGVGWAGLSIWCLVSFNVCIELAPYYFDRDDPVHVRIRYPVFFFVNATCIIGYVIVWISAEVDKKAFLLSAVFKLLVLVALLSLPIYLVMGYGLGELSPRFHCFRYCWNFFSCFSAVFSILAFLCAAAGLSGLARMCCIGRCLAGTLAPGCRCCKCLSRRAAKRPNTSMDGPA